MYPPATDPLVIARLVGEVENLRHDVRQLLDQLPPQGRTWLTPAELAKVAGVSTRTLGNWRQQGCFRPESLRSTAKGWQFHARNAQADLGSFR